MGRQRVLFVTGKLAEKALRRVLDGFAHDGGIEPEIAVLPISVAALAHTRWMAPRLKVPEGVGRVVIPGMCSGDLEELASGQLPGIQFERGPNDLLDLPGHFKRPKVPENWFPPGPTESTWGATLGFPGMGWWMRCGRWLAWAFRFPLIRLIPVRFGRRPAPGRRWC